MTRELPSFSVGDLVFFVGNQEHDVWGVVLQVDVRGTRPIWVNYIEANVTYPEPLDSLHRSVWAFGGPVPAKWRTREVPYTPPSPVVVDIPSQGIKVFMPTGLRKGHQPTHYTLIDICVFLVACQICDAKLGKLCVFRHVERAGTHAWRRHAAKPLVKNLHTNSFRFGKVIPNETILPPP